MICIQNDGEINIGALTLLGASTKEGVEGKIGFFGSGAKYALAVLLRERISLRIFSGEAEIEVGVKDVEFGGQAFEQIVLNGQTTSFTTRMGPAWEIWFAMREFICNAMDEGGYALCSSSTPCGSPGVTRIFIEETGVTRDFVEHIDEYILTTAPLDVVNADEHGWVSIIPPAPGNQAVCYRLGIRIVSMDTRDTSIFRYDFSKIDINESRLYTRGYEVSERMCDALAGTRNKEIIRSFLDSFESGGYMENKALWQYCVVPFTPEWEEVLGATRIFSPLMARLYPAEDAVGNLILPENLIERLHEAFPHLNIVGQGDRGFRDIPDERLSSALSAAQHRLELLGYAASYRLRIGEFTDDSVMALTQDVGDGFEVKISISHHKDASSSVLRSTLLEEIFHVQGYRDGSREFEQHLIAQLLEAKGEAVKMQAIRGLLE
jgi:hypothetical protein